MQQSKAGFLAFPVALSAAESETHVTAIQFLLSMCTFLVVKHVGCSITFNEMVGISLLNQITNVIISVEL